MLEWRLWRAHQLSTALSLRPTRSRGKARSSSCSPASACALYSDSCGQRVHTLAARAPKPLHENYAATTLSLTFTNRGTNEIAKCCGMNNSCVAGCGYLALFLPCSLERVMAETKNCCVQLSSAAAANRARGDVRNLQRLHRKTSIPLLAPPIFSAQFLLAERQARENIFPSVIVIVTV